MTNTSVHYAPAGETLGIANEHCACTSSAGRLARMVRMDFRRAFFCVWRSAAMMLLLWTCESVTVMRARHMERRQGHQLSLSLRNR